MRITLLASAAMLGLAFAPQAFAQTDSTGATTAPMTTPAPPPQPFGQATPDQDGQVPPGKVDNAPASNGTMKNDSMTSGAMDNGAMTPKHMRTSRAAAGEGVLPADGSPHTYLAQAQDLLQHHRPVEAERALERAETRLLDRATAPSAAGEPDTMPLVKQISDARAALGRRDWSQANQLIDGALKNPRVMSSADGSGSNAASPGAAVTGL